MKTLAICHRKGGVGKTTTAVNMSAVLAERGQRVLLIDLDSQRNASLHLGVRLPKDSPSPAYKVLAKGKALADECMRTPFGFDLLPCTDDLVDASEKMTRAIGGQGRLVLREALQEADGKWDTVIIDCPPDLGMITTAAMIAAQGLIIPMIMHKLPYEGLLEILEVVTVLRKYDNPALKIEAVFATIMDDNTILAATVRDRVEQLLGVTMLPLRIRRNNALAEASEAERPVTHYKPDCNGAFDYRALVTQFQAMGVA